MNEVTVTKENFEKEVLNSPVPVLLDFWASWCGPCMMLAPVMEEIADENVGKIKVGKVNVDEQEELSEKFGINSIPAVFAFKSGKAVGSTVGYQGKEEILSLLK